MYYAEKMENGKIYCKSRPDGEWREFTPLQYVNRIMELENALAKLNRKQA